MSTVDSISALHNGHYGAGRGGEEKFIIREGQQQAGVAERMWTHLIHAWDQTVHMVSHQVICGPDARAALVAQLDVPAGGQQDGQGRLHAHRAERRPVILISRGDDAPAAAAATVGGTACCRCNTARCSCSYATICSEG